LIGRTQTHGAPAGGSVRGSGHANELQSRLGGGGGNAQIGWADGAFGPGWGGIGGMVGEI
jgi:hypothetical protein